MSPVKYNAGDGENSSEDADANIVDDIFEIIEGTTLAFDHIGNWDVSTSTFYNASVSIIDRQRGGCKRPYEEEDTPKQAKNTVIVPTRRQHKTMHL